MATMPGNAPGCGFRSQHKGQVIWRRKEPSRNQSSSPPTRSPCLCPVGGNASLLL